MFGIADPARNCHTKMAVLALVIRMAWQISPSEVAGSQRYPRRCAINRAPVIWLFDGAYWFGHAGQYMCYGVAWIPRNPPLGFVGFNS